MEVGTLVKNIHLKKKFILAIVEETRLEKTRR